MSATVFIGGKFRAFTADGSAPLSGGLLYAYKAGTTTAQDTYTDQSGLTANTNPVVLDATGSADVWLTGNYKFILKDASGFTQWTEDNISDGIFSTAFSANSSTSVLIGSGNKTFVIQSGKAFAPGQFVVIASNANPANYMNGSVVSYTGTTLVVNVVTTGGSGTYTDWNIGISGPAGPQGSAGSGGTGSGNVNGPAMATDGYLVLFDGTTGKLIKQGTGGPGSAAYLQAGTAPNNVVQLDGSGNLPAVPAAALTSITATNLVGLVPTANLGTGASSSTFLRGDQTYAVPSATIPTTSGAVNTYALLSYTSGAAAFGSSYSGAALTPFDASGTTGGSNQSGTWRCMGYQAAGGSTHGTLFLRIA